MKKASLFLFVVFTSLTCFAQDTHERWDVKTLTDGFTPDIKNPKAITVSAIEPQAKVRVRNTQPRMNFEKQIITIKGKVVRIQLEKGTAEKPGDMDYHIEISDGTEKDSTLVCEAVDPNDKTAATSPMIADFIAVRKVAETLQVGDSVIFTGVMFQDKYHNPSPLRTRNFVEMHPILKARKF